MSKKNNEVRVVSDGTIEGTQAFVGGVEIHNLKKVSWCVSEDGDPEAVFTISNVSLGSPEESEEETPCGMTPGGVDIVIPGTFNSNALVVAVSGLRRLWPRCVVDVVDQNERIVCRDQETLDILQSCGAVEEIQDRLFTIILSEDGTLTTICDGGDEHRRFLNVVEATLRMNWPFVIAEKSANVDGESCKGRGQSPSIRFISIDQIAALIRAYWPCMFVEDCSSGFFCFWNDNTATKLRKVDSSVTKDCLQDVLVLLLDQGETMIVGNGGSHQRSLVDLITTLGFGVNTVECKEKLLSLIDSWR